MTGTKMGAANLQVFAETVEEIAGTDPKLLVVTSDSRGSGKLAGFADRMPERMVEVGIAEQNLVGVAAGLTAGGRNVVAVSPASFLATRSLEQIKHDVCYSDRAVTLVGISAGVSYGTLGSTHHSLHDFAALRAIHNITVVAPADNWETRETIRAALAPANGGDTGPVYIRFGKQPVPDLPHTESFVLGKGRVVRDGTDAAFIATGETVWRSLMAAETLGARGLSVAVVSMHTVKPLDTDLVRSVAGKVRAVITVEEHSEHGGLGDACARVILQAGISSRFRVVAIPDEDTVTGSQEEILGHYGISESGLARTMGALVGEG
jgi:transketolase